MVGIAHLVKKSIQRKPFLEEALAQGIVNYAALAMTLKPEIEGELNKEIKVSAIAMALRRLSEELGKTFSAKHKVRFNEADLTVKSNLFEVTVVKMLDIAERIKKIYGFIDFQQGDFLAVTQGLYEVTIISSNRHEERIAGLFSGSETVKVIDNLSSLTVKIPREAVETQGFFYVVTKALNWHNINIVEIVSTLTEMTFILNEKDVPMAFKCLKELTKK